MGKVTNSLALPCVVDSMSFVFLALKILVLSLVYS